MKSLLAQAQHQFALSEGGQIVVTHGDPVPKDFQESYGYWKHHS